MYNPAGHPLSHMHPADNGQATTIEKLFSRQTTGVIDITVSSEKIWNHPPAADSFESWNTTIIDLTRNIVPCERMQLRFTLASERTFTLKIMEFDPHKRFSWGGAMGTRVYTLTPSSRGETPSICPRK